MLIDWFWPVLEAAATVDDDHNTGFIAQPQRSLSGRFRDSRDYQFDWISALPERRGSQFPRP